PGVTINLATGLTSVAGGNTETILNFENVEGSQGGETIVGSSLSNVLNGNGGNDTINGGAGNDIINGGTGNDILNGGTGRDTVNGGVGSDRVIDDDFVSFDVHNGGDGIDTIDYSGVSFAPGVTINLATGLTSVAGGNTETILNFENVEGSQGGETIVGSSLSNVLNGNGGNDTINGGAGNDIINGGTGNDSLIGGTGNDILTGGGDGQIDVLTSGSLFDRDTFVLGTGGIFGSVLYDSAGNADFARITDFDLIDFVGEPATEVDRIQLRGTAADYRLVNSVVAGGFTGVGIYDRNSTVSTTDDDLIALVQGVTAGAAFGQLNLTNTTQFVFV
nr:hypothetical protein [Calothrix sp. FACHB-1219]